MEPSVCTSTCRSRSSPAVPSYEYKGTREKRIMDDIWSSTGVDRNIAERIIVKTPQAKYDEPADVRVESSPDSNLPVNTRRTPPPGKGVQGGGPSIGSARPLTTAVYAGPSVRGPSTEDKIGALRRPSQPRARTVGSTARAIKSPGNTERNKLSAQTAS